MLRDPGDIARVLTATALVMIMTPALTGFGFFESFLLLKLVGLFTPLRVSIEEEEQRLDLSEHGDDAYGAG